MKRTAALCIIALFGGCSDQLDRPIKLVLPNDFQGEFRIVKDQSGSEPDVLKDYYVYRIPPSGELKSSNIRPFFRWHQLRAEYADGRLILDYSQDIYSNHGLKIISEGTTAGHRETGPNSSEGSTDFDGTTMRWKVIEHVE